MVKVDELNNYIEQFGTVTHKLDTLADSAEKIEKTSQKQEELADEVGKLLSEQKDAIGLLKTQWTEAQASINTHVDNSEKHISDKIQLLEIKLTQMESNLTQMETNLAQSDEQLKELMTEQAADLKNEIKAVKNLQYAAIACALIAAILVVVMHFI